MAREASRSKISGRAPDALRRLVDRFDADVFDAPRGRARIRLEVGDGESWDAVVREGRASLEPSSAARPDALLSADARTWSRMADHLPAGMEAYRARRLRVRQNLHLGVGFLAATSGDTRPGRLRFGAVRTARGRLSTLEAGVGEPVVLMHGLGGTKASFLPTLAAFAPSRRLIAVDLPGFGDSDKPFPASYDPPFFADWVVGLLDALELEDTDLVGHSLGGRVALELGFRHPERVRRLVLLTPSLAWLRERSWAPYLRLLRPELGLLQPSPRALTEAIVRRMIPGAATGGWTAAGVDEFLRSYLTARGRAAFYASARQIYLEDPDRFWPQLAELAPESLFVWARHDPVVPFAFARHVRRALPAAEHVELDCGHVPQLERPRETHAAIDRFLRRPGAATGTGGKVGARTA